MYFLKAMLLVVTPLLTVQPTFAFESLGKVVDVAILALADQTAK